MTDKGAAEFIKPSARLTRMARRAARAGGLNEDQAVENGEVALDRLEAEAAARLGEKLEGLRTCLARAEESPKDGSIAPALQRLASETRATAATFGYALAAEIAVVLEETVQRLPLERRATRTLCAKQIEALRLVITPAMQHADDPTSRLIVSEARDALERLLAKNDPAADAG